MLTRSCYFSNHYFPATAVLVAEAEMGGAETGGGVAAAEIGGTVAVETGAVAFVTEFEVDESVVQLRVCAWGGCWGGGTCGLV